ncbi:MAG: hypothetical protein R3E62_04670 [Pseudomonadales bacterium]|jgi:hypothetical protein
MFKKIALFAATLVFTAAAQADVIAVYGSNSNANVVTFLNNNGHTATNFGSAAPTAAQLVGVDAVINLRGNGNADVANFVNNGGLLITEWQGAEWALDTANLLNADGGGNLSIGTNTPITHTAAGLVLGLGDGLANPFADGPRTQFQWTLGNIGAGVDILATRPGDIATIIGGVSGSGYALINSLDWADSFPSNGSVSGTWLLNALNIELGENRVPVVNTVALLGLGLVGLSLVRRRAKNA